MAIVNVIIEDGCTSCGLCESICPDVFKLEDIATVIPGADFNSHENDIKEAADSCPVEVIKYN